MERPGQRVAVATIQLRQAHHRRGRPHRPRAATRPPTYATRSRHGMTISNSATDWAVIWTDVAGRIAAHREAGRGHLLTEDTVRLETILSLGEHGIGPDRLAAEVLVPVLAGGKLDLAVDPPDGTVIELKYPRDSRTGFSP